MDYILIAIMLFATAMASRIFGRRNNAVMTVAVVIGMLMFTGMGTSLFSTMVGDNSTLSEAFTTDDDSNEYEIKETTKSEVQHYNLDVKHDREEDEGTGGLAWLIFVCGVIGLGYYGYRKFKTHIDEFLTIAKQELGLEKKRTKKEIQKQMSKVLAEKKKLKRDIKARTSITRTTKRRAK